MVKSVVDQRDLLGTESDLLEDLQAIPGPVLEQIPLRGELPD